MYRTLTAILLYCFLLQADAQPAGSGHVRTLFLVGDGGEPHVRDTPIGAVLSQRIADAERNAMVLFLGDNIYPAGLPDPGSKNYDEAVLSLRTQVEFLDGTDAQAVFIPGNHDWQHWGKKGLEYVRNQQAWFDSLKDQRITQLPRSGCPGPVVVQLNDNNVLVILDTQWFLHEWEKPVDTDLCGATTTAEVLLQVEDVFRSNRGKRIIVAAHHPLITYGEHGGVFTWKAHLFPLEEISDYLYIPFPVIGSLYPLYRSWFGHRQDTKHALYREFGDALRNIMAEHPGSLYVAGHEHALQYILRDSTHFIVSGSASKTEWVKKKKYAVYAKDVKGFAQIDLHADGALTLAFVQVDENFPKGEVVFTKTIPAVAPRPAPHISAISFEAKSEVVRASDQYRAGSVKKRLLGENYRAAWAQPVEVPVFDLGAEKGGLKVLQKGGGQQTLSLRLADSSGREWVLRSVEKYPAGAIPEVLQETFAADLVQDQISAAHPYAALTIAPMAEAVGLYHTNPKLVYIPDDPRFGEYTRFFANTLALFEERPDEDWSDASWFGKSENIISTRRVLEKLADDNDNTVDQQFVLRNRLFDLIIGDWDRHDDQWRWATTERKKTEVYRPIPRDRDQAFFVNEGWLAKIWSRRWALPKFEGFDEEIDWPSGLSYNARHFDRTFLNGLSKEDWIKEAEDLKTSLTDSDIQSAIREWPESIYRLDGDDVVRKLKARRDNIVTSALSHYDFLAREVDISGSDKMELFEVTRLPEGHVRVTVHKVNKNGKLEQKMYDRTFLRGETKEIRMYGLGGDDRFVVKGHSPRSIRARVIGGAGHDLLQDSARVGGTGRTTIFYDQQVHGEFFSLGEVRDRRSTDPAVNEYDRMAFEYDRLAPLVWGQYNPDDRLFIGGGFFYQRHGFRKEPYRERHLFLTSFAPDTRSYNFLYQGKFIDAVGQWDFGMDADVKSPNYVNNFFGMGNESVFDDNIDDAPGSSVDESIHYYRYRFNEIHLFPSLTGDVAGKANLQFGPVYQQVKVRRPEGGEDRFIESYAASLQEDLFVDRKSFAGLGWSITAGSRDDEIYPHRGSRIQISGRNMFSVDDDNDFSSFDGSLSFYYSPRERSPLVFAARAGGGANVGTYPFYQAQILDGKTSLRGYRKTRFYGDSRFFANGEIRLKLANFQSYLFPASLGILAFYDMGRIWYKNEDGIDPSAVGGKSHRWHHGIGGGIWFTPFNVTVLSVEAGHSREGTLGYLRLGFLF